MEIKWNIFPFEKPGTTLTPYLVATKDPDLISRENHAVVVSANYANGRFYMDGARIREVYAWASWPAAPMLDEVIKNDTEYVSE